MQNVDFTDSQTPHRHHAPPHRYLHNVPHQQLSPPASHHQNQFSIYSYYSRPSQYCRSWDCRKTGCIPKRRYWEEVLFKPLKTLFGT